MTSAIRKTTLIDRKSTVDYWRERLSEIIPQLAGKRAILCLIETDNSFDTVFWADTIYNVINKRASLVNTKLVVETLEKYIKNEKIRQNTIGRKIERHNLVNA
jgi:hypothetical protein